MEDSDLREKIRSLRKEKGLTLKGMSNACKLSSSYLSQVETGAVNPSLATIRAIADALEISLSELFADKKNSLNPAPYHHTKQQDRKIFSMGGGMEVELLTKNIDVPFEFILSRWPPISTFAEGFHSHEGSECGMVLEGELKVEFEGQVIYLKQGDTITLKSSIPHRVSNPIKKEAVAIWVDSVPWIFTTK